MTPKGRRVRVIPINVPVPRPHHFTAKEFERIARSGGFGDLRVELRRGLIVQMNPRFFLHVAA